MTDLGTIFEGVYLLEEWHVGQNVLRPPQVHGRFVLVDGEVITLLKNWAQPASRLSVSMYGSYAIDASGFSYQYDHATIVTETPTETKVSYQPVFDGARSFVVSREPDGLHFRRAEGGIGFLFTADGMTYSEDGKALRVWRRA